MAEDEQSQEKTEQASPKRLKEAREKGQVARSKDLNALIILLFTGFGFSVFGGNLAEDLARIFRFAFQFDTQSVRTPQLIFESMYFLSKKTMLSILPLLLLITLFSIVAPLVLGGWVFSWKSVNPQVSRLNPLKGVKRMFSLKSLVEMIKAIAKFILIATVAIMVIYWRLPALLGLAEQSLPLAVGNGLSILIQSCIIISGSLIIIAAIDVPFQLYEHQKQLKMTKQELKDEFKETEGKPEVKSQIRRKQQEMAQRRMMSEVPKATVVLTNPTHYAVAICYQTEGNRAPYIVAKGKDLIAFQIARIAKNNEIPVLSLPPLARAIYFSTKLNMEVPRELYVAVAQVLAYIFQLGDKREYDMQPETLINIPIPENLKTKSKETE